MAICLIAKFPDFDSSRYDAMAKHLGYLDSKPDWPKGLRSHVAGPSGKDWCVVDVWDSQANLDAFFNDRLKAAFEATGGTPPQPPSMTIFPVHFRFPAG